MFHGGGRAAAVANARGNGRRFNRCARLFARGSRAPQRSAWLRDRGARVGVLRSGGRCAPGRWVTASIRARPSAAYDFAEFLGVGPNRFCELFWRTGRRVESEVLELKLNVGIGERTIDVGVDAPDDVRRRPA